MNEVSRYASYIKTLFLTPLFRENACVIAKETIEVDQTDV